MEEAATAGAAATATRVAAIRRALITSRRAGSPARHRLDRRAAPCRSLGRSRGIVAVTRGVAVVETVGMIAVVTATVAVVTAVVVRRR
jgi:hypothetical protein